MAISRTEIKFRPNVPEQVVLDQSPEKAQEYESNYEGRENRFRHFCNGNRNFFYIDASVQKQLLRTRADAGDTIQITKTKDGDATLWRVEVLAPEQSQPSGPRVVNRTAGATALAPQAHVQPANPPQVSRGTSHLAQALCLAIDAAIQASEYARAQNFSVTFLGSDIRAMANTVMIQDGGRS